MTMTGADADALEAFATSLERSAAEIHGMQLEGFGAVTLASLGTTLSTVWRGPRARDFANLWQSRHLVRLRQLQAELEVAARDIRRQAAEQRRASQADGFSLGILALGKLLESEPLSAGSLLRILKELGLTLHDVQTLPKSWGTKQWYALRAQSAGLDVSFASLSAVSFLASKLLPKGSEAQVLSEGSSMVLGTAAATSRAISSVAEYAAHLKPAGGVLGKVGPVFGIVSGGIGVAGDIEDVINEGWNTRNELSMAGHGATMVGSAMMLTPAAPVGAVLVAAGSAVELGFWIADHQTELQHYADDALKAIAGGASAVNHAVDHAVDQANQAVNQAVSETFHNLEGAASSSFRAMKGLFT